MTLICAIVFAILALLYLVFLCCGFADLKIAIGILDASADFLLKTKRIFYVPVFYFFITCIVYVVWVISFAAL